MNGRATGTGVSGGNGRAAGRRADEGTEGKSLRDAGKVRVSATMVNHALSEGPGGCDRLTLAIYSLTSE
jgi:hypothetical protein